MYLLIFATVAICSGAYVKVWGQLWELVPSFCHVDPKDWIQVISLGGKWIYFPSNLIGSTITY